MPLIRYAHYDNFKRYFDQFQSRGQLLPASHEGWAELRKGMDYMRWRISIPTGNKEERYFTMLKVWLSLPKVGAIP
mgnify:CR=1 FL=1